MRPIDGNELIKALVKWNRFGLDDHGRLTAWTHGGEAYVKLEDVLDTIARMPEVDIPARWVPAEKAPKQNGSYLVTFSDGWVVCADFSDNLQQVFEFFHALEKEEVSPSPGWYVECEEPYILTDVTHAVVAWMPLPEHYRKEEEE